jgi:hypothetical protein
LTVLPSNFVAATDAAYTATPLDLCRSATQPRMAFGVTDGQFMTLPCRCHGHHAASAQAELSARCRVVVRPTALGSSSKENIQASFTSRGIRVATRGLLPVAS